MDIRLIVLGIVFLAVIGFVAMQMDFSATGQQAAEELKIEIQPLSKEAFLENEKILVSATATGTGLKEIILSAESMQKSVACVQSPCSVEFEISFEEKGIHYIEARAVSDSMAITSKKNIVKILPSKKTCIDGTIFGECSTKHPLFCAEGNLLADCAKCGCLQGLECLGGLCVQTTTQAELEVSGLLESPVFSLEQAGVSFGVAVKPKSPVVKGNAHTLSGRLFGNEKEAVAEKSFVLEKNLQEGEEYMLNFSFGGTVLEEGTYSLSVSVDNGVEKTFENALVVKQLDDTAPSKPSWSNWRTIDGGIELSWLANNEDDLKSYLLYESVEENPSFISYRLRETIGKSKTALTITGLLPGKHFFTLKAVDWYSNESEYSDVLEIETS